MKTEFSVTQNGKELEASKYTWNEKSKTFSTTEYNLVLSFSNIDGVTFITGSSCTFKTGSYCTFDTGSDCTFDTGSYCTFKTGSDCTFDTGSYCTFKTGSDCTFDTGSYCTFNTNWSCTFDCEEVCVCIRRDVYEIIEIPKNKKIKLNEDEVKGFTYVDKQPVEEDIIEVNGVKYKRLEE